jgi:hypothetical protein
MYKLDMASIMPHLLDTLLQITGRASTREKSYLALLEWREQSLSAAE